MRALTRYSVPNIAFPPAGPEVVIIDYYAIPVSTARRGKVVHDGERMIIIIHVIYVNWQVIVNLMCGIVICNIS